MEPLPLNLTGLASLSLGEPAQRISSEIEDMKHRLSQSEIVKKNFGEIDPKNPSNKRAQYTSLLTALSFIKIYFTGQAGYRFEDQMERTLKLWVRDAGDYQDSVHREALENVRAALGDIQKNSDPSSEEKVRMQKDGKLSPQEKATKVLALLQDIKLAPLTSEQTAPSTLTPPPLELGEADSKIWRDAQAERQKTLSSEAILGAEKTDIEAAGADKYSMMRLAIIKVGEFFEGREKDERVLVKFLTKWRTNPEFEKDPNLNRPYARLSVALKQGVEAGERQFEKGNNQALATKVLKLIEIVEMVAKAASQKLALGTKPPPPPTPPQEKVSVTTPLNNKHSISLKPGSEVAWIGLVYEPEKSAPIPQGLDAVLEETFFTHLSTALRQSNIYLRERPFGVKPEAKECSAATCAADITGAMGLDAGIYVTVREVPASGEQYSTLQMVNTRGEIYYQTSVYGKISKFNSVSNAQALGQFLAEQIVIKLRADGAI